MSPGEEGEDRITLDAFQNGKGVHVVSNSGTLGIAPLLGKNRRHAPARDIVVHVRADKRPNDVAGQLFPAGRYDLDGVREASVGQIFRRLLVLLDGGRSFRRSAVRNTRPVSLRIALSCPEGSNFFLCRVGIVALYRFRFAWRDFWTPFAKSSMIPIRLSIPYFIIYTLSR